MAMFGRNKNKGNGLMMTLVGIGVGAAAYGLMRGRINGNNGGDNMMEPIQKAMNQMRNPYS